MEDSPKDFKTSVEFRKLVESVAFPLLDDIVDLAHKLKIKDANLFWDFFEAVKWERQFYRKS